MPRDYYSTLSVPRTATTEEIKQAYRKLALRYHPDKNPGDASAEEKFKELNEAYQVLSDPQKKAQYDQFGTVGTGPGFAGGNPFGDVGAGLGDIFGDIFENFFGGEGGGRRRASRLRKGADLRYDLSISLEEAYHGTQAPLQFERVQACEACGGTGAKAGTGLKRCSTCRGSGRIQYAQGFFSLTQTCNRCQGEGQIIENPCSRCQGNGKVRRRAELKVRVPPGIREGTSLRIAGEGEVGGFGAPPGDLYVLVQIRRHPTFERLEDDLLIEKKISFPHAALGTLLEIATLNQEKAKIKVPAGTQSGTVFRVREMGMPRLQRRGYGDLMVKILVEIPQDLTERQRELLQEFSKTLGEEESSSPRGFFKRAFKG
ncbi:MAG: molecular chaperone DnaJ [Elusimicrobia bacterium]|nr:molecular chaperone DnaJ [Elusimicrobiota bacterium]